MGYFIKEAAPAAVGVVTPAVDNLTSTGIAAYVMPNAPDYSTYPGAVNNPANILVFVGGVYQAPTVDYTIAVSTITFVGLVPASGVSIQIVHHIYSTNVPPGSEF